MFDQAAIIDHCLVGTGENMTWLPPEIEGAFSAYGLSPDTLSTRAAVRTWNIMHGEGRRAAALLIALA